MNAYTEEEDVSVANDGESLDQSDSDSDVDVATLYPDPLALIDTSADLDAVLAAKTIGEAIQMLCPNMPGLPSKQRGKYRKRRNLSENEKDDIMRARNRDNARRTRKRKKIYLAFLNKALADLQKESDLKLLNNDGVEESAIDVGRASSQDAIRIEREYSSRIDNLKSENDLLASENEMLISDIELMGRKLAEIKKSEIEHLKEIEEIKNENEVLKAKLKALHP